MGWLEAKSPMLFLAAGVVLVVFAANTYMKTHVGTSYQVIQTLVGPTGFFLGVVGLLGLHPALAARAPKLARGVVPAALLAVGWAVIIAGGILETAGVLDGEPEIFAFVVIALMILSYLLFGATTLYTGARSWVVGVLLLLEAAMLVLLVADATPFFLIDAGHVLIHLGVGTVLWTADASVNHAGPAPDSTA